MLASERPGRSAQLSLIALTIVVAALHARPLFLGQTFLLRDYLTYTLPSKNLLAGAFSAGRVPLWWDGIGLGVPAAANPAYQILYPPAWLLGLLPFPFGLDLYLIGHVLLAGVGATALARRLGAGSDGAILAGALLMTSGTVTSLIVNGIPVATLAWTPWIALASDRVAERTRESALHPIATRAAVLSALVALQVLAGDPAGLITSSLLAIAIVVVRAERRARALAITVAALAMGPILAAASLVPALGVLSASERAQGLGIEHGGLWSMHPLRLIELVWPGFLGDPTRDARDLGFLIADSGGGRLNPSWTLSGFLGAPALVLAASAAAGDRGRPRRERIGPLIWVALAFAVIALGTYTPIYEVYRFVFVPERFVRFPEKHFVGALVVFSALAGVGHTRIVAGPPPRRMIAAGAGAAGVIVLLVSAAALFRSGWSDLLTRRASELGRVFDVSSALDTALRGGLLASLAAAAFAALLAGAASATLRAPCVALIPLTALAPAIYNSWMITPVWDRARAVRPPVLVQGSPDASQPREPGSTAPRPRIYRPRAVVARADLAPQELAEVLHETAAYNIAAQFGFAAFPGAEPAQDTLFLSSWDAAVEAGRLAPLLALFDVPNVIVPPADPAEIGLPELPRGRKYRLERLAPLRPRAFVAPRWVRLESEDAVRRVLLEATIADPASVRLLRGVGGDASSPPGERDAEPLAPCSIRSERPERVELRCSSRLGGYAVLLDAFAPGWTAEVDGVPAAIERADLLVRGVRIDPGEHVIRFSYETPGLRAGLAVSAFAWLALLGFVLATRGRRSAHPSSAQAQPPVDPHQPGDR